MKHKIGKLLEGLFVAGCVWFACGVVHDYAMGRIDFAPCTACENGG